MPIAIPAGRHQEDPDERDTSIDGDAATAGSVDNEGRLSPSSIKAEDYKSPSPAAGSTSASAQDASSSTTPAAGGPTDKKTKTTSHGNGSGAAAQKSRRPFQRPKLKGTACAACRKSKLKCDEGQPCVPCARRKVDCIRDTQLRLYVLRPEEITFVSENLADSIRSIYEGTAHHWTSCRLHRLEDCRRQLQTLHTGQIALLSAQERLQPQLRSCTYPLPRRMRMPLTLRSLRACGTVMHRTMKNLLKLRCPLHLGCRLVRGAGSTRQHRRFRPQLRP